MSMLVCHTSQKASMVIQDDVSEEEVPKEGEEDQFEQMVVKVSENSSQFKPPPSFMHRPAYKALNEQNLVNLPPLEGVGLWCHKSTSQWHAHFGSTNFAPTWGNSRSEEKAILLAVQKIWQWYKDHFPKDKAADKMLAAISAKLQAIVF